MRSSVSSVSRTSRRFNAAHISRLVGSASSLWCLTCAMPAMAQSVNGDPALGIEARAGNALASPSRPSRSFELERAEPSIESPTSTTARLYRTDATPAGQPSQELRARAWLGKGAASLGVGTDWAAVSAGSALRPLRPVVGVRADVSDQTRVVYEVRGAASAVANVNQPGAADPEARWALEFKSAANPAQNLRNGLFRVQLSNTSALFVKPRSGGMVLSYRSQF